MYLTGVPRKVSSIHTLRIARHWNWMAGRTFPQMQNRFTIGQGLREKS